MNFGEKSEELARKHEVKVIGGWCVPSEHLGLMVYEAPRLEAFQKFNMEPEMAAIGEYFTTDMKVAVSIEETMEMLKQAK